MEGSTNEPPCMDEEIIENFKIGPICKLQNDVSGQREAFLKLMKFTKQSPTFQENEEEFMSVFQSVNKSLSQYGYYVHVVYPMKYTEWLTHLFF